MKTPLRILLSGALAGIPEQGGASWAVLQYLLGLRRLGHDVCFVEPVRDAAASAYVRAVAAEVPVAPFALLGATCEYVGISPSELRRFAATADVLLNISGCLRRELPVDAVAVRVFVDLDPVFTQLWAADGIDVGLEGHTHFATVGTALTSGAPPVPTLGLTWVPTVPPVVLTEWPRAHEITCNAFTTVANWRSYGPISHEGVRYGQKAHSIRRLLDLPQTTGERFVLALSIHPDESDDLAALAAHGWELVDAATVARTPGRYRAFVRGSRAEIGFAKEGYVVAQSGWFSDRSACYLAAGRPVLAQDTGWTAHLPAGEGLFAFTGADDVAAAAEALQADYARHSRAARELAEEHLDSDRVLTRLLQAVGIA